MSFLNAETTDDRFWLSLGAITDWRLEARRRDAAHAIARETLPG